MNWQQFQTYNDAPTRAFEALCNQIFELWVNREYGDNKKSFVVVNGAGGDGGVEAYATLVNGNEIGVQAKWFTNSISTSQFNQFRKSILTALDVHPNLEKYIVCIPKDLSNSKKGKDGKIVEDSEYYRWTKLVEDVVKRKPEVKIELWGDSKLENYMLRGDAAGIRRHWFNNTEISIEQIRYSFDMQKAGWLKQRYISVLHNKGKIHKELSHFLGDQEECAQLLIELNSVNQLYEHFLQQAYKLNDLLVSQNRDIEKQSLLQNLCSVLQVQLAELSLTRASFVCENTIPEWVDRVTSFEELSEILDWLEENSNRDCFRHFSDVKKSLEDIINENVWKVYERLKQRSYFKKILIMGAPGTGKTHGIANEVEIHLEKNYHVPLLIQAKAVNPQDEWKDILFRALGLSHTWNEEEIWTALEALSYRNEVDNPLDESDRDAVRIIPKFLICIDGIDEIRPFDRWCERMNQTAVIVEKHPRIRFCFTGRPYAFVDKSTMKREALSKKVVLADDGDVSPRNIFESYIEHYGVNIAGAEWLKYSITTPYALKILCELYEGQSVKYLGKSNVIITNLLKQKIYRLDIEFKKTYGLESYNKVDLVKSALLIINEAFRQNNELTDQALKAKFKKQNFYTLLGEPGVVKILEFFEENAFLQSYKKQGSSLIH